MLVLDWLYAFEACHSRHEARIDLIAWPDGCSYLEQEDFLIDGFILIKREYQKAVSKR